MHETPRLLALSDGAAGNARQALALAEALARLLGGPDAPPPAALRLDARAPWRWLSPQRAPGDARAFGDALAPWLAAPPTLVVGCGRQAALATRLLRARGARVVQILDPRIDPAHWDLVVAPAHDGLRAANALATRGSLHPVDDAWLAAGRAAWPALGALPGPRTALLLGGPVRGAPWTARDAAAWAATLAHWHRAGGSVLATGSRRSPAWLAGTLAAALPAAAPGTPRWWGEADGPNPYAGLLGWADRVVVGPDSVNLASEACATGVPVFVAGLARARGKHRRFLEGLLADGHLHRLEDGPDAAPPPAPLRECAALAAAAFDRLGLAAARG